MDIPSAFSPSFRHQWFRRLQRIILLGSAGLLILLWLGIGIEAAHERQQTFTEAERENAVSAQMIALHTDAALKRADDMLRALLDVRAQNQPLDLYTRVQRLRLIDDMILQVAWAEADGTVTQTSIAPGPTKVSIVDRAHFRIHVEQPGTGAFISHTLRGRVSQRWSIQLSRAARAEDGRLLGVMVASIDPTYFILGLGQLPLRPGDTIAITGADGYLRIRIPSTEDFETRGPLPDEFLAPMRHQARQGAVFTTSSIDGIARLYRSASVPGYQLDVFVGRNLEGIEQRVVSGLLPLFGVGVCGTLLLIILIAFILHQTRQQQAAQVALEKARAEARAASEAKSRFLANMSHELRTPLNAIMGFSEIIATDALGPRGVALYRDYGRDIHRSAAHLHDLISDILDLSRIESGRFAVQVEQVDIGEVVEEAIKVARDLLPDCSVSVNNAVTPGTLFARADQRAVQQILLNLLSNALKYTPAGGSVAVSAASTAQGVEISIADTGVGIPADHLAQVLEPYAQGGPDAARRIRGTGIGLSIVRSLIEQQGGSFDLSSIVGAGTTARVLLPAG